MDQIEIVQKQLEAYNAHDLERFTSWYSSTIRIYKLPSNVLVVSGKEQLAKLYGEKVFIVASHKAELLSRSVAGNIVVDHERVYGLRDAPFEAFAVYEITDGKISTVWIFSA